jgi:hypothetical protein
MITGFLITSRSLSAVTAKGKKKGGRRSDISPGHRGQRLLEWPVIRSEGDRNRYQELDRWKEVNRTVYTVKANKKVADVHMVARWRSSAAVRLSGYARSPTLTLA